MAAVLACRAGAVSSHRSAAALWDLRQWPARVEVTAPAGAHIDAPFTIHQSRHLPPSEVTVKDGIPCTTPARTLVDLAAVDPRGLERVLEQSLVVGVFDLTALDAVLVRSQGRRGVAELRRLVARLREPAPVNSELERRFLALVRAAGLPAPGVNEMVEGHRVDFNWRAHGLIVETDGRVTHDNPIALARDRARDLDLDLAGWHVRRIGWHQVVDEPHRVTAMLRRHLMAG